jgi:putative nucleotidyltransferase with HDIG domain
MLERIKTIPSMPVTLVKLGDLLSKPETEVEDIVKAIQFDPGFTANTLKMANSAYFGFSRQVGSLREAIIRIGIHRLFQIMVANSLRPMTPPSLDGYGLTGDEFWMHCIAVAVTTESLAATGIKVEGDCFTAGLLHDMGKLITSEFVNSEPGLFVGQAGGESHSFDEMESELLGSDHAETGAKILESWNFPGCLIAAARHHHRPEEADDHKTLVNLVHVADALCISMGIGAGSDALRYRLSPAAIAALGLTIDKLERATSQTLQKMETFGKMMEVTG